MLYKRLHQNRPKTANNATMLYKRLHQNRPKNSWVLGTYTGYARMIRLSRFKSGLFAYFLLIILTNRHLNY